jgi:hypothetical protein
MIQSGEMPANENGSVSSIANRKMFSRKNYGGPMHKEEIKMNKALLHEISDLKRKLGDRYSSPGQSSAKALMESPPQKR